MFSLLIRRWNYNYFLSIIFVYRTIYNIQCDLTCSGNSMYNLYDEDEDSSMEERSSENAAMRDKVRNLKAKMRVLNSSKKV